MLGGRRRLELRGMIAIQRGQGPLSIATKNMLLIQDEPTLKKRFSNEVPSKFCKSRDE